MVLAFITAQTDLADLLVFSRYIVAIVSFEKEEKTGTLLPFRGAQSLVWFGASHVLGDKRNTQNPLCC